jgi:hypothetical protein
MIEVRIRRSSEAEARHLTAAELDKLDTVIETVKGWGIQDLYDLEITGQFVIEPDKKSAFFEVVVHDDED